MNTAVALPEELIGNPERQRPHVVILGAGASKASCVNGDKNGRHLPTMNDLVAIVGLEPLLARNGIVTGNNNFEALYSSLHEDSPRAGLIQEIESVVHQYFSSLELPDHPTVYDHLLLSLRQKDAIFTFNWDPFLFDAWVRNRRFALPEIFFLHGNVRTACCPLHPDQWGAPWAHCTKCRARFIQTKLLYPIAVKNYAADQFIASQWESARWFLAQAFTLTIFGYSAPKSDIEAVEMMKSAWQRERMIERVEIIDVKTPSELFETWKPFISHHHYDCRSCFYQSYLANYPRRSSEALFVATTQGRPAGQFPIPRHLGFEELYEWLDPIARHESKSTAV